VGVEQNGDVLRLRELRPVHLAEARRRALLQEAELEPSGIEIGRLDLEAVPQPVVVDVRSELADALSSFVMGLQLRARERPAAVRQPGLGLEIARIERRAPADPVIGRAAEMAQAGDVERVVWPPDHVTMVEVL